jgi:hypothetical protein
MPFVGPNARSLLCTLSLLLYIHSQPTPNTLSSSTDFELILRNRNRGKNDEAEVKEVLQKQLKAQ